MNRRGFLGMSLAAAGMVFAPKFGRWHRQGSGLFVPSGHTVTLYVNGVPFATAPIEAATYTGWSFDRAGIVTARATLLTPFGKVNQPVKGMERGLHLSSGDTLTIRWPDPLVRYAL